MLPQWGEPTARLDGRSSFAELGFELNAPSTDDSWFGIQLSDDGLRWCIGPNQRGLCPFDGQDIAFSFGDPAHNKLQVHGKVNHVARLKGAALEG